MYFLLGNTYILEDGTVIEQQNDVSQTAMLLYVLCNEISGDPTNEEALDI